MSEQILSDEQVEQIRERLDSFMSQNLNRSNSSVANNIGMSSGTISLFRNGKYAVGKSKISELALRIKDYLESEESELNNAVSKGSLSFVQTTAAKNIFKVASYASEEHTIGVVTGVFGCGKTISVTEYKRRNSNTILIQATPLITVRVLIQEIAKSLKIPIYSYSNNGVARHISNYTLFEESCKTLNGTKRLIIFDECERFNVPCIEIIRRIQDFTQVGILLAGTPELLNRLRGPRSELGQIFSRVGISKEIHLLCLEDIRAILKINFPEAIEFANTFMQLSKNNGRLLQHLIRLVKRTINDTGSELNDDLIDLAAGSLFTGQK